MKDYLNLHLNRLLLVLELVIGRLQLEIQIQKLKNDPLELKMVQQKTETEEILDIDVTLRTGMIHRVLVTETRVTVDPSRSSATISPTMEPASLKRGLENSAVLSIDLLLFARWM